MEAYIFYCSKCKIDHGGECKTRINLTYECEQPTRVLTVLEELVKALEMGSYSLAPGALKKGRELIIDGDLDVSFMDHPIYFYTIADQINS